MLVKVPTQHDAANKAAQDARKLYQVRPQDNAAEVNELPARGVSLTIGAGAGSDVAVETADIVLGRNNQQDVVAIAELSRATCAKMIQNLF